MKTLNWIVASSLLSVAVCLPARAQSSPALMLVEQQQLGLQPQDGRAGRKILEALRKQGPPVLPPP